MTIEDFLTIEQIKQLRSRYSHCYDSLDEAGFLSLFTEDAVLEVDEKHGGCVQGREQIRRVVQKGMASRLPYEMIHLVSNPLIELLDENNAVGKWYLLDYNFSCKEPFRVVGVYHDRYKKVDGVWKFSHMKLQFVYPYRWPEDGTPASNL